MSGHESARSANLKDPFRPTRLGQTAHKGELPDARVTGDDSIL
jgi:hypothetical protein